MNVSYAGNLNILQITIVGAEFLPVYPPGINVEVTYDRALDTLEECAARNIPIKVVNCGSN